MELYAARPTVLINCFSSSLIITVVSFSLDFLSLSVSPRNKMAWTGLSVLRHRGRKGERERQGEKLSPLYVKALQSMMLSHNSNLFFLVPPHKILKGDLAGTSILVKRAGKKKMYTIFIPVCSSFFFVK